MFAVFKYMKELFQISKLLKSIKNISLKSKSCNNPIDKMFVIIEEIDVFDTGINRSNSE